MKRVAPYVCTAVHLRLSGAAVRPSGHVRYVFQRCPMCWFSAGMAAVARGHDAHGPERNRIYVDLLADCEWENA